MIWMLESVICVLSCDGFPSQATKRKGHLHRPPRQSSPRARLSVLQLPLPTFSLQSGILKTRYFNLDPIRMSKLALKSACVCLKAFIGIVKEVRKEVRQEAAPCLAHLLVQSSAVLLHCCCLFSYQLTCKQLTFL